jgi:hypothetical protein
VQLLDVAALEHVRQHLQGAPGASVESTVSKRQRESGRPCLLQPDEARGAALRPPWSAVLLASPVLRQVTVPTTAHERDDVHTLILSGRDSAHGQPTRLGVSCSQGASHWKVHSRS